MDILLIKTKLKRRRMIMKKLTLTLAFLLLWSVVCRLSTANAAIPDLIRYQGTAVDTEGIALEGPYDITLRIYTTEVGGIHIWEEVHQQVSISKGVFTVLLGEITALDLPFDQDYYLSIEISNDGEMSPRQRITSVGYAYRAKVAELATEAETAQSSQEVAGYSVATGHSPASQIYASKSDGYLPEVVDSSSIKDGSITNSKLTNNSIDLSTKTTGILPIEKGGTGTDLTRYCSLGLNTTGILPTQYGGTGTDEQAYCDLNLNTSGTLPIDKGGTGNSTGEADTVDGIHASTTPEAGKLIALNGSSKIPNSALDDTAATRLGSWTNAPIETVTQAATDGMLVVYGYTPEGVYPDSFIRILTDSNNPPTTVRAAEMGHCSGQNAKEYHSLMCPVRKGDFYLIEYKPGSSTITSAYWIPLEYAR